MDLNVNGHNIFEIVLITFLSSLILVPIAKRIAVHIGAIDMPGERKIHKVPIPRMGGFAIFMSFLLGYILYGEATTQMLSILIGSFIIFLVGLFDDIKPVKAKYKFLVLSVFTFVEIANFILLIVRYKNPYLKVFEDTKEITINKTQ